MKLNLVLMLCCIGSLSANPIFSQQQKVDVSHRNELITNVIESLKAKTGVQFFYQKDIFLSGQRVSVDMKDAMLEEVLNSVLTANGYSYYIENDVIVISSTPVRQQPPRPVMAVVKGTVRNAAGAAMEGVTVVIKGTSRGTITDVAGNFQISAANNEVIAFSFISKKSQEVTYSGQAQINIVLEDEIAEIDNVVVTGLFSRPAESYTGAARTFNREQIAQVSSGSLLRALSTLDPSIQMPQDINLGSNPNVLPEITLRGGNSLIDPTSASSAFNYNNSPNTPLFILDGFEVSLQRINDLDINRVMSVVTLKDATATTIYGSRAANGVIVIKTVPADRGELRVSYTGQTTLEFPDLKGYDLLNAKEKHELDLIAMPNTGFYGLPFYKEFQALVTNFHIEQIEKGVDFDWLRLPLRNAIGHKHSIYIEGGDESIIYGINGSYDKRAGIMRGSDRENMGLSSSLHYRRNDLMFRNELSVAFNTATNSPYGSFSEYARMNPYWAPVDENGNIPYYVEDITAWTGAYSTTHSRVTNPYYNATLNILDQSKYQIISENLFAQWNAAEWLKFTGRFAYTKQNDESDYFLPAQHTKFDPMLASESYKNGSYTKGYGRRSTMETTLTSDYSQTFGKHVIFVSTGMTLQEVKYSIESFKVEGFPNDRAGQLLMGNRYPENAKPSGSESISRLAGYFANTTYTFDTRFLFDASFRYDGSSLFGGQKRFAPFYSLGAGWNIHNESFMKDLNIINRLKIRYSYGYTGSQNFESYLGVTTSKYYTNQDYRYHYGTYMMGYGNESLQWQRTAKHNIGLDLVTLKNKLNVTFDYFNEITEGSIATVSLAPSTGFTSYKENMGDVTNKGWELHAQYIIFNKPEVRNNWSVFFNAFHVNGKIKKVSNMLKAMNKTASETLSYLPLPRYVEGMSTTAIWAVESLGIDPGTGLEIYRKLDGTTTNTYNAIDQVIVGDTRPDLEGTFGTNFEYKGWGANLFFRYRFGGQTYNQTLVDRVEQADLKYNVDRRVLEKRWKSVGDRTFFKGLTYYVLTIWGSGYNNMDDHPTYATSRFVEKDNLLSLESVSLYYRFADKFNNRLGIANSKLSFYMQDVFWFSTVKRERGLEYPFSRQFTLQLQFTF